MIYLVRHGQTNDNKYHIIQGNKSLNKIGRKQVKQTAFDLRDETFDICFCSPLKRTKQTLKIIKKYHKNMPVIFDNRLKERYYGNLVGVCYDAIKDYRTIRWKSNVVLDPSVENADDMYERIAGFYSDILPKFKNKNILIVAHSGVARMTYFYFNGKPRDGDYTKFEIENSQILKIEK